MVAYRIKGDYMDCQLYGGNLFLWTYSGQLKVYNFNKLIWELVERGEVSEEALRIYEVGALERTETRFPTDSEVYGGTYYVASRNGLFQTKLNELEQGFKKVWDCPLLSVSGKRKKGLTMAGGEDGVFLYSEADAIRERYGMKDARIVQASPKHANYSAFCSRGIYATSILDKSFYLKLPSMGYEGQYISVDEIFPNQRVTLSWSYRNKIYAYIDENIYIKQIERDGTNVKFTPLDEYWFYPQKGKVLSGTSTDFADLIELEHAFVIFPTHRTKDIHAETIWEPVTRWRTFPKSIGYNSVIMVILEDELRLYLVDGLDGLLFSSGVRQERGIKWK